MDRITGKKMLAVFDELTRERTVLRLNALGRGYEGLTIATGVVNEEGASYLLVDYPAGFEEVVQGGEGGRIRIEFLGADRVPYSLRTRLRKVTGSDLWLDLPQFIERIQRRGHFRVAPPVGSKLVFSKGDRVCESSVIDLNLGGALTSCRIADSGQVRLFVNEDLVNLTLSCASSDAAVRIRIKKAVIKRIDEEAVRGRTLYALQFIDMGAEEKKELEAWILGYQREVLRKRSLLGED